MRLDPRHIILLAVAHRFIDGKKKNAAVCDLQTAAFIHIRRFSFAIVVSLS